METQIKYADILADILEKKHSKCICPTEYLADLEISKAKVKTGACQFGPYCQFTTTCQYNQTECTCYPQCTCGPVPEPPTQSNVFTDKSEESLIMRPVYKPPAHCNRASCICSICLCRVEQSNPNLLPNYFRNAVKIERKLMSDKEIKQECDEIKQLLSEHKENKDNEENKHNSPPIHSEHEVKKIVLQKSVGLSINEDVDLPATTPAKISERKSMTQKMLLRSSSVCSERKSILKPKFSAEKSKIPDNKEENKGSKKKKSVKRKYPKQITTTKTKQSTPFTGRSSVRTKIPRMRYYYSGGTEHYGVKLGHKHCLGRAFLVPKHMGWLWNIEDHSKGLRERKGWPPGFIGKSIKNMIKVMKRFEETNQPAVETNSEVRDKPETREITVEKCPEYKEDPPILHIHKKGRNYNITFCPKNSDEDVGPIPIPFSIKEKKRDSDSESSDSTLEFELYSPKPKGHADCNQLLPKVMTQASKKQGQSPIEASAPFTTEIPKKKPFKKRSKGSEENKILWEEQQTQIQNIV